jgi:flagellar protein FlgJ
VSIPLNNATQSLAVDGQSLQALRAQAKQAPDKALKAAAQQFESVFLNMMLKSMREATPQDGMLDNEQTKMFTGMLDQQFAQNMATRGVGLADIMVKQLSRDAASVDGKSGALSPAAMSSAARVAPQALSAAPAALASSIPSVYNASTQQDFMARMLPHAVQASSAGGVPAHLMLGQAALESGWGKREIHLADGSNSYNLFGIKAGSGWTGKVAEVMTTEYQNGVAHQQVEKFRAYDSYAAAFQDYAHMMNNNPRYAGVLQQGGDAAGMAQALQKAGYATDPNYADKLVRVMSQIKTAV